MNKSIKITKPSKKQMCELGYHVVRGHYRICQSGTKTWVDAHRRKNKGRMNLMGQSSFGLIIGNHRE